jgi:vitamin K-dependent gamma-carboxylase
MRSLALQRLFAPVDIAWLVYFRLVFGAIMLWEVYRYFDRGWIERYFIDPTFFFTYLGFGWVRPWEGDLMYAHFYALGVLAAMIMLGLFYRVAAALFFLGFTQWFLIDQANYLNHFYLISLVSFLMVFLPAHRAWSLDALIWRRLRSDTVPAWTLWLMRAQIGIPYFYGGLAKLNGDWLRGYPMKMWLPSNDNIPIVGAWLDEATIALLVSYGGLLLDLLVVPLLLWKPTRVGAYVLATLFHLANAWLFRIGIFPWFMIAATLIYFPPHWPRLLLSFGRRTATRARGAAAPSGPLRSTQRIQITLVLVYLAVQLVLPLRHFLYPGPVSWTEEGHLFAWHMKLRDKDGWVRFVVTDPATGKTWMVDPQEHLSRRQANRMEGWPDMIHLFSLYLAEQYRQEGHSPVEVRAEAMASLNGREHQLLIDPTVDLAARARTLRPAEWIMPLYKRLPDARQP